MLSTMTRALAAVVAVAGVAAAGCGGGTSGGGDDATIEIGTPPVVGLGDLYVGQARGLFKQQGLTVKVRNLNGGAALLPALQGGAIDVGHSNLVSVLQANARHLDVKCFAGGYRTPQGKPQLALVVSPKAKARVTSGAGLRGRTVAVNTLHNANELIADSWLAKQGVDASTVKFVAMEYPEMPAALASGRVDAAITDEPFGTTAVSRGAKVLAAQPDAAIAPHPAYPCWVATGKYLDAHRSQIAKFKQALAQADAYITAHPAYLRTILPQYTTVTPQLAKQVVLPDFDPSLSATDVRPWEAAAKRFGVLQGEVAPGSILDHTG